jgi:hypothetical protein
MEGMRKERGREDEKSGGTARTKDRRLGGDSEAMRDMRATRKGTRVGEEDTPIARIGQDGGQRTPRTQQRGHSKTMEGGQRTGRDTGTARTRKTRGRTGWTGSEDAEDTEGHGGHREDIADPENGQRTEDRGHKRRRGQSLSRACPLQRIRIANSLPLRVSESNTIVPILCRSKF